MQPSLFFGRQLSMADATALIQALPENPTPQQLADLLAQLEDG
jgi:hypothetical protein